jgi:nondiscriminating aspartyl-tRNA synthetase
MSETSIERIRTTEISAHVGQRVHLQGWLHAVRRLGGVTFVILRDGWGTAQAVVEAAGQLAPIVDGAIQPESVIRLSGVVTSAPAAPGGVELHQPELEIITPVTEALPVLIGKKEVKASLTTQLDHAVFVNRHPARRAVYRLGAGVMAAFRQHLNSRGFTEIQTPKIVASATESGANVFAARLLRPKAFLAQSPQFYKQIMVGVFERVYEVGARLPRRAARHHPPHQRVRQSRRRAWFHREPLHGDGRAARCAGRTSSTTWQGTLRCRVWSWRARRCRSCRQRSRTSISPMRKR